MQQFKTQNPPINTKQNTTKEQQIHNYQTALHTYNKKTSRQRHNIMQKIIKKQKQQKHNLFTSFGSPEIIWKGPARPSTPHTPFSSPPPTSRIPFSPPPAPFSPPPRSNTKKRKSQNIFNELMGHLNKTRQYTKKAR